LSAKRRKRPHRSDILERGQPNKSVTLRLRLPAAEFVTVATDPPIGFGLAVTAATATRSNCHPAGSW
jgi:hypothetical protein